MADDTLQDIPKLSPMDEDEFDGAMEDLAEMEEINDQATPPPPPARPPGAPQASVTDKSDDELLAALARENRSGAIPAPAPAAIQRTPSRPPAPRAGGGLPPPGGRPRDTGPNAALAAPATPAPAPVAAPVATPAPAPVAMPAPVSGAHPPVPAAPQIIERPVTSPLTTTLLALNLVGIIAVLAMTFAGGRSAPARYEVHADIVPSNAWESTIATFSAEGWELVACSSVVFENQPAEACTFRRPTDGPNKVTAGPNRQRYDATRRVERPMVVTQPAVPAQPAAPTGAAPAPEAAPAPTPAAEPPAEPAASPRPRPAAEPRPKPAAEPRPKPAPTPQPQPQPQPQPNKKPTINPFG